MGQGLSGQDFLHEHKIEIAAPFVARLHHAATFDIAEAGVKGLPIGVVGGDAGDHDMHAMGAGVIFQHLHQRAAKALALGLNPISLKIFTNYALELAPGPAEHPRYVSIVGAALAAPFVFSPLIGLAIDVVGFRPVFGLGAAAIAAGAVVGAGLPEPRRR